MDKKYLKKIDTVDYNALLNQIGSLIVFARGRVAREINKTQVISYWHIGRYIVEFEQKGNIRAEYGTELLKRLSIDLISRYGRGFSVDNLQNMRNFYIIYPKMYKIYETLSRKSKKVQKTWKYETPSNILSWSHYCELLKEDNEIARSFYEKESTENSWSVRELKRQMNSMLFERLALSKDKKKENEKGQDENDPIGLILCARKNEVYAKYILGGLKNKIFTSKYKLTLPSERQLHKQLTLKNE